MRKRSGLFLVFLIAFLVAMALYKPIINPDYVVCIRALRLVMAGQYPYGAIGANGLPILPYLMPPWSFLFLAPLAGQPTIVWLSLTTAVCVTMLLDLSHWRWSALLLLAHPAFIGMIASSNPEWLLVGSGLWLLYRSGRRGWLRGVVWLLLSCKPQTTFILLVFDGVLACRQRDWRPFVVAVPTAASCLVLIPGFFDGVQRAHWSVTVLYDFGVPGAIIASLALFILYRLKYRHTAGIFTALSQDWRSIALLLAPIWAPYMLQYSLLASAFTMRRSGLWRIFCFMAVSLLSVALFWDQDHGAVAALSTLFVVVSAVALRKSSSDQLINWRLFGIRLDRGNRSCLTYHLKQQDQYIALVIR